MQTISTSPCAGLRLHTASPVAFAQSAGAPCLLCLLFSLYAFMESKYVSISLSALYVLLLLVIRLGRAELTMCVCVHLRAGCPLVPSGHCRTTSRPEAHPTHCQLWTSSRQRPAYSRCVLAQHVRPQGFTGSRNREANPAVNRDMLCIFAALTTSTVADAGRTAQGWALPWMPAA